MSSIELQSKMVACFTHLFHCDNEMKRWVLGQLTHLPLVPHIHALINWVSIGSNNGLSPIWRQAIIETNAGLLSIGPLGTNFNEILIKIQNFSFMKIQLKISSAKWRPFCQVGDEFNQVEHSQHFISFLK